MNQSLGQTIRLWRTEQSQGSSESFWRYLVRTNPWIFAHHPANECFHEHVWTFRGLHFCKGCVMTVAGWLVAVILQLGSGWLQNLPIVWIACIFTGLLLPSVATALYGAPRGIKHISRLLLGVLMTSAIWLFFVTNEWWVRGVLIIVYFSVKVPLDRRRARQNEELVRSHCMRGKLMEDTLPQRGKKRHAR